MNRKILLIEPDYKNKYPPMGLMKLATYYRNYCQDDVRFFKGNLKEFAATLLCEEYYSEVNEPMLGKYFDKLIEYIKTGRISLLDLIPNFCKSKLQKRLKEYRTRFKTEDFPKFDVVCVTTLFTFYWEKTINTINYSKKFCKVNGRMLIGGIAASILPNEIFLATGIRPHVGLLDRPRILDTERTEIIDELLLDYSILEEIEYKYPTNNAYFAYMTRGCTNKCAFCVVPRLEPEYKNYISLKQQLEYTESRFGKQKDLLLLDNNVFASKHFDKIIDEIKACGFAKGATYLPSNEYEIAINNLCANYNTRAYRKKIINIYNDIANKLNEQNADEFFREREKRNLLYIETAEIEPIIEFDRIACPLYNKHFKKLKHTRYVDFNQGIDARLVTDEKIKKLSEININPLRIAFDHYSMCDIYVKAIRLAAKYKIKHLSNYLLYNFEDKPEELYYRIKINVNLCYELGVIIYSFPMKYHPIDHPEYFNNRDFIGKHWNRKFIRAIQAILNATKGKVGKGKEFFEEAFGKDIDEYNKILWMPEAFIIYRRKYDQKLRDRLSDRYKNHYTDENDLVNEWWEKFSSLSEPELSTLKKIVAENKFSEEIINTCENSKVRNILEYYMIKHNDI